MSAFFTECGTKIQGFIETAKKTYKKTRSGVLRDNEFNLVSSSQDFVDAVVEEKEEDVYLIVCCGDLLREGEMIRIYAYANFGALCA